MTPDIVPEQRRRRGNPRPVKLAHFLSFRTENSEPIYLAAKASGLTLSEFVRRAAESRARRVLQRKRSA